MNKTAIISECGRFRYRLGRRWGSGPALLFVMLNPSIADADIDDPTIRRCIGFARAHAFDAIGVVNLFAYRATDPADLRRSGMPIGPDNDAHIKDAAMNHDAICVAWGAAEWASGRVQQVMPILCAARWLPHCLHTTKGGHPGHPLYLAAKSRLRPFDAESIYEAMHP